MFSSTRYIICGYHRARLFWNEAIEIYRYPRATPSIFFNLAISRIFFFSLNVFFFFPEANVTRNSFIILSSVHQLLGKRGNYPSQLPITITKQILGHHLEEDFHFLSQFRFKLCKFKLSLQNSSFFFQTKIKLSSRIELQFTFPSLWRLEFSNILLVDGRKLEYAEGKFVFFYERLTEGDQLGGVFRFRCYPLNTAFPETHILVD